MNFFAIISIIKSNTVDKIQKKYLDLTKKSRLALPLCFYDYEALWEWVIRDNIKGK